MNVVQQAPSPQTIRDLATACTRYINQALSLELDYSPDTLPILDHYLDDCRKLLLANPSDPKIENILPLVIPAAGAYFGEVVRQTHPHTTWHAPGDNYSDYRLSFDQCSLVFNPIGVALEAVHRSPQPGWEAHFQVHQHDTEMVRRSLEAAGPVRSMDFFRLAVRFEVLDQIAHLLIPAAPRGPSMRQV